MELLQDVTSLLCNQHLLNEKVILISCLLHTEIASVKVCYVQQNSYQLNVCSYLKLF